MDMSACDGVKAFSRRHHADETLARIAATIGCSIDALRSGRSVGTLGESADLLRFWLAIESPEDRRRLLELTRAMADGSGVA